MSARTRMILTAAVAALALSACGGETPAAEGGTGSASTGPVTVVAEDLSFDPESLTIASGATVILDNQGALEHDFVVEGTDVEIYAEAGETAEGTVDIAAGSYTFYCSVAGHRESGMEGSLTVE